MEKVKIVIIGEGVHEVGYRVFLLNNALNFGIDRFNAYNAKENGMPAVIVLLEADEEIIDDFYEYINKVHPEKAEVSEIRREKFKGRVMNMEQYMHFAMVEQLDKGVPAILGIKSNTEKMLEKQDITIDILKSVKEDTAQIRQDTGQIRQDTAQIRQDTAQIRQDTAQIPKIVENTEKILDHTSYIPAMREDTASIRNDTREIATKLWEKYEELSKEIAQMKITLSKIEAKVFS